MNVFKAQKAERQQRIKDYYEHPELCRCGKPIPYGIHVEGGSFCGSICQIEHAARCNRTRVRH